MAETPQWIDITLSRRSRSEIDTARSAKVFRSFPVMGAKKWLQEHSGSSWKTALGFL
jgi:hypothetical protein